jgi:hypothetical protein
MEYTKVEVTNEDIATERAKLYNDESVDNVLDALLGFDKAVALLLPVMRKVEKDLFEVPYYKRMYLEALGERDKVS